MSHRPEQVASVIRRAVQEQLLRGVHDPRVRGLVSVTRVTVDDDLSEACVHVSVLPAEHEALAIAGLRSAASHLRRKVREGLPLRRMPHLRFMADDSLKKAAAADAALVRAARQAEGQAETSVPPDQAIGAPDPPSPADLS